MYSLLPAVQYSLLKELKDWFPLKTKESANETSLVSIYVLSLRHYNYTVLATR